MKNLSPLSKKAIKAARCQDWDKAAQLNEEILEEDSKNINAMNRLALAYMQQGHPRKSRWELEKVLEIDPHNKIAQKNLKRVKNKQQSKVHFGRQSFIEEPGKAKNIKLTRVPTDSSLEEIGIGQECQLEPKSTYISIYAKDDDQYLGALPEQTSNRLKKLIKQGNTYKCTVKAFEPGRCVVHICEKHISEENEGQTSFAIEDKSAENRSSKIVDEYKVKDDIPLGIVNTDTDEEVTQKKFSNLD